jgi:glutaredoxin
MNYKISAILLGLLATALFVVGCNTGEETAYYDTASLAECLTENDYTFFGAFWCPHCADQKELFGEAVVYLDYVECDPRGENPDVEACVEAGVESYPHWQGPDGRSWTGTQPLETLAEISGCELTELTKEEYQEMEQAIEADIQ